MTPAPSPSLTGAGPSLSRKGRGEFVKAWCVTTPSSVPTVCPPGPDPGAYDGAAIDGGAGYFDGAVLRFPSGLTGGPMGISDGPSGQAGGKAGMEWVYDRLQFDLPRK